MNKVKLKLINLIYLFFIILIIYLVYILIISLYDKNNEKFIDTPISTSIPTSKLSQIPTNIEKTTKTSKETSKETSTPINTNTETSTSTKKESCKAVDNVVDFCINYDSCCAGGSYATKACFCNHPITLQCKAEYDTCMSDTSLSKLYTTEQLKQKCASQQKNCCIPYNSISLSSDKFDTPIKNEPSIKELCSVSSIPNIEQKCLELCQTTPDCKAYSVNVGKIVQSYGVCKLYDTVSILTQKIDPISGKPADNIDTDYYIKK